MLTSNYVFTNQIYMYMCQTLLLKAKVCLDCFQSCFSALFISLSPFSDFLPLFVWVLAHTTFYTAEIEAEYIWGLAHPSLFNGEGGYYLTTLTSAGKGSRDNIRPTHIIIVCS